MDTTADAAVGRARMSSQSLRWTAGWGASRQHAADDRSIHRVTMGTQVGRWNQVGSPASVASDMGRTAHVRRSMPPADSLLWSATPDRSWLAMLLVQDDGG